MSDTAASPAATGPGGAHFEVQVGAYYLLAMLLESEARGFPHARIEKVQLQGAGDDFLLDDVIIHGRRDDGSAEILEIQVKRSITFAPSDETFKKVACQIADTVKNAKAAGSSIRSMAIATAQHSRQIDRSYQEVVRWARQTETAPAFFRRLKAAGANNEMRTFVETLRGHMAAFEANHDDETIWEILRRLQILVFDFAVGGESEALARERCSQALEIAHRGHAGAFWSALIDYTQEIAKVAGEKNCDSLRGEIAERTGLRLAGSPNHQPARRALAEASRYAMDDIDDRVGSVILSRQSWLDLADRVRDAGSRFIEFRGTPGVGKSNVMLLLARELAVQSNVIVLSPTRTPEGGWPAMARQLGFTGTANEMIGELAASGGATLFIDNLDFYGEKARATVKDLLRGGVAVPGFTVVVTARSSAVTDDAEWLPADVLTKMGRTTILIEELDHDEVRELSEAAPNLAALLANEHQARSIVRNLFRLGRLAKQGAEAPIPGTEVEMAVQWWQTGDGKRDASAMPRTRLLRALGAACLPGGAGFVDGQGYPPEAVRHLLNGGNLTDLGGERLVFRHDVLRDWAVMNLLIEDSSRIDGFPLDRPAPALLIRGFELYARKVAEDGADDTAWKSLLEKAAGAGCHGSWSRTVLMAAVRSERAEIVLDRIEGTLLADRGKLLGELIRIVKAVERVPANTALQSLGIALPMKTEDVTVPHGPAWKRLAVWVGKLAERTPAAILPDVVELFVTYAWSAVLKEPDSVRPLIARLHVWLMEFERYDSGVSSRTAPPFSGGFHGVRVSELHQQVLAAFAEFSLLTPELADELVRLVLAHRRGHRASVEAILRNPGSLPSAAPDAVAELTAAALIQEDEPGFHGSSPIRSPFTFLDSQLFLNIAPTRGPFLALLRRSPTMGLALVRKLIRHACTYDGDVSDVSVTVEFDEGLRHFPFKDSYYWSRQGDRGYCVTTALRALEAWGHERIDGGEDPGKVTAEILTDDEELPAAFLLVAVDLVLSHFDKSSKAAIPFVSSPELLSLERTRPVYEQISSNFAFLGSQDTVHRAAAEALRKKRSRTITLEELLPHYADDDKNGKTVIARVRDASARLGNHDLDSNFSDPRFMSVGALLRLDRENYHPAKVQLPSGEIIDALMYKSPPAETQHLERLQSLLEDSHSMAWKLFAEVSEVLVTPSKAQAGYLPRAVTTAIARDAGEGDVKDSNDTVLIAAALAMRDGDADLRTKHGEWAASKIRSALVGKEDAAHRFRGGLRFNPIGAATVGAVHAAGHGSQGFNIPALLGIAVKGDPAAAYGFGASLDVLDALDPRLTTSILRCAFVGCVRPRLSGMPSRTAEDERLAAERDGLRSGAVKAEVAWLSDGADEPNWPTFPSDGVIVRKWMTVGGSGSRRRRGAAADDRNFYADSQAAAIWTSQLLPGDVLGSPIALSLAARYRDWTSEANGAGQDRDVELVRRPDEWNRAYFHLVAYNLPGMPPGEIDRLCLDPVIGLPDEEFLHVMEILVTALDRVYFTDDGLDADTALRIRTALRDRMAETSGWHRLKNYPDHGLGSPMEAAVATFFFGSGGFRQLPTCYVQAAGIRRLAPFLRLLKETALEAPCLHVAWSTVELVSVSNDIPMVEFGVEILDCCLKRFPDDKKLWVDKYGVGGRFCVWIKGAIDRLGAAEFATAEVRRTVEDMLARLVRLGVTEASPLERLLADARS